jgi:hypothetical protein
MIINGVRPGIAKQEYEIESKMLALFYHHPDSVSVSLTVRIENHTSIQQHRVVLQSEVTIAHRKITILLGCAADLWLFPAEPLVRQLE